MSNDYLNRAWYNSKAKGTTLLVLLSLADQANDDGFCWPGNKSLARRAKISPRAVQRHTQALEEMGEIRKETRKRPNKSTTSNGYYILLPPYIPESKEKQAEIPGMGDDKNVTPPHDKNVTPPMTDMSPPEPSLEPSLKNIDDGEENRNPYRTWESITGSLSSFIADTITGFTNDWQSYKDEYISKDHPDYIVPAYQVVIQAMETTAKTADRPNLKYVAAVLDTWKKYGIGNQPPERRTNGREKKLTKFEWID